MMTEIYNFSKLHRLRKTIEEMDLEGPPTIHLLSRADDGIKESKGTLGVFPSSFNPITVAHVELMERAVSDFAMDEVLLVLDKKTLDKEVFGATLVDRLLMLLIFCRNTSRISVGLSSHGLFVDKIAALQHIYPQGTGIHFIVGFDTITRVLDKKYYDDRERALEKLFGECSFLATNRGKQSIQDIDRLLERKENRKYARNVRTFMISDFLASISSTQVRDSIERGEDITQLVPSEIEEFISETGLYKPAMSVGKEQIQLYDLRSRVIEYLWNLNPNEPTDADLKRIIAAAEGDTALGKEIRRVFAFHKDEIPPRPRPSVPSQLVGNFDLVTPLFSLEEAQQEARRCLHCEGPPCERHCLQGLPIVKLLTLVEKGMFEEAYVKMREAEPLCGMTEYLCQTVENYCERHCVSAHLFGTGNEIAIQTILRTLWDYGKHKFEGRIQIYQKYKTSLSSREKKVAIVGSGPAGLRAAMGLAKIGYHVSIFERKGKIGGIPRYETPLFRFPAEEVFQRIEQDLQALSIEIRKGVTIGLDMTIDDLIHQGFAAIFIATGLTIPKRLTIPGEDLKGVSTSIDIFNEFHRNGLDDLVKRFKDKRGYVIDSGNTAMDTSRLLRRFGADVTCIFWKDAPRAYPKEFAAATKEGVSFLFSSLPVKLIGDDNGILSHIRIVKTSHSGRSGEWEPVPGTENDLPAEFCMYAIGARPNFKLEGIKLNSEGHIIVNSETMQTTMSNLLAGGDAVERGNISTAIRDGRRAAQSIHRILSHRVGNI